MSCHWCHDVCLVSDVKVTEASHNNFSMKANHMVVAVMVTCCVFLSEGSRGNDKSLRCILQQDHQNVPPKTEVLPNGDLLFNQLQYAINRCPFSELYIPPTSENSPSIECLTIADHAGPFLIRGTTISHATTSNRSTIVINASSCAASERRALISVIASADIVLDGVSIVVLNPVLPIQDDAMNTFVAIMLNGCSNVTLRNVVMDLIAQGSFELVGWGGLMQVNNSRNIFLHGGKFVATTLSYAVSQGDNGDVGMFLPPLNLTFPYMTTIAFSNSQQITIRGTSIKTSSDLGHVCVFRNVTDISMINCAIQIDLVMPPPFKSLTTNKTVYPPSTALPTPLMLSWTHTVVIVGTEFTVVCGLFCDDALLPAVVHFSHTHDTFPKGFPSSGVRGVLIRDTHLVFTHGAVGQAPGSDSGAFHVASSSNFIVISAPSVECVVVDNVTTVNALTISSNVLVIDSTHLTWSVLSRVQLFSRTTGSALPMQQSMRFFPQAGNASVLTWSDLMDPPPVPSEFLLHASPDCRGRFTANPQSSPSSPFWHCCSEQTVFWVLLLAGVSALLFGALLVYRRRAGNSTTAATFSPKSSEDLLVPDPEETSADVGQSIMDPLLPSDMSIARSAPSPRDEPTCRRPRDDPHQVGTPPKNGQMCSGDVSACNSDMVLYMPGDGGWSSRSVMGPGWVWTPRQPGTENSGQNSVSATSLCNGSEASKNGGQATPAISLSPPRTYFQRPAVCADAQPIVVKGTSDATPFDSGRQRAGGESVHSSQFSSSTDGDSEDEASHGIED